MHTAGASARRGIGRMVRRAAPDRFNEGTSHAAGASARRGVGRMVRRAPDRFADFESATNFTHFSHIFPFSLW